MTSTGTDKTINFNHKPRKRFGQNFLVDRTIIEKIADYISPSNKDHIVEIGAGTGALTEAIIEKCYKIDIIEIDRDLIPILQQRFQRYKNCHIHQADALTFDFKKLTTSNSKIRVIGNLPYNISTPLIFYLLKYTELIQDMSFMLQKEVVDRICAHVGSASYGRLTISSDYQCKATAGFSIDSSAFMPRPKVESSLVHLKPKPVNSACNNQFLLHEIVKESFSKRRKTLRNALKHRISDEELRHIGVDSALRPEKISLTSYIKIANLINQKITMRHTTNG